MNLIQKNQYGPFDLTKEILKGRPVIFPTDTLPALGVAPKYAYKLWEIKKRPKNKPLILMASSINYLIDLIIPEAKKDALEFANLHWPGALTMVFPTSCREFEMLNPFQKNIGMRIPNLMVAQKLLSQSGPLATTSANISGERPILNEKEAYEIFPEVPFLGPTPWPKPSGCASTVISWESPGEWKLLRKGSLIPENVSI